MPCVPGSIGDGSSWEDHCLKHTLRDIAMVQASIGRPPSCKLWILDVQVRRMVIGKKGAVVGEIGITARAELSVIFKNKVHLYLEVKLR